MDEKIISLAYDSPLKIVLINFGGIGDEILLFPVIEALREHFPLARICTVVEPRCKDIMENNFFIDKVYTLDTKSKGFKLNSYIDFLGRMKMENPDIVISSGRSPLVSILLYLIGSKYRIGYNASKATFLLTHKVNLNMNQYAAKMLFDLLKPLGIESSYPLPNLYIPAIAQDWAKTWLIKRGFDLEKGFIAIHTGVSKMSKQKGIVKSWQNEKWIDLINLLWQEDHDIVMLGGSGEKEEVSELQKKLGNKVISACGETEDINQLAAIINYSTLLVCVDSSPMHIAVALKKPLVALFGPTDEQKILPPRYLRFSAVRTNNDCRPCLFDKRKKTCEELYCINDLTVDTVYSAIKEHLFHTIKETKKVDTL